jgi:hypothetical protein
MYLWLFIFVAFSYGFIPLSIKKNFFILHCKNKDDLKVFAPDLNALYDQLNLTNIIKPITEETIKEDSFEGYLRRHFKKIQKDNYVNFETFYKWRTTIGTVLTKNEIKEIYDFNTKDEKCTLINFIKINNAIDEIDAADPLI